MLGGAEPATLPVLGSVNESNVISPKRASPEKASRMPSSYWPVHWQQFCEFEKHVPALVWKSKYGVGQLDQFWLADSPAALYAPTVQPFE